MSTQLSKFKNVNFCTPVLFRGHVLADFGREDYLCKIRTLQAELKVNEDIKGSSAIDKEVSSLKADLLKLTAYFDAHMEAITSE